MSASASVPDLLTHDVVVMQQVSALLANDFEILDGAGNPIGILSGSDSTMSRFLAGPREFTLRDLHGNALLCLADVPDLVLDSFELSSPTGRVVATLRRRLALFRVSVDISTPDGVVYELRGKAMGFDYQIHSGDDLVAQASRAWAGVSQGLLGHSRYVVTFTAGTDPQVRLLVLGTVVALDLIRMKERNS